MTVLNGVFLSSRNMVSAVHPAGATISPGGDESSETGGLIVLPTCASLAMPPLKSQRRIVATMEAFSVVRDGKLNKVGNIELSSGESVILGLTQAGSREYENLNRSQQISDDVPVVRV